MNRLKEIKKLRGKAESLKLENAEILRKYNMQQLCAIYNGIGPDAFPDWLRDAISALHPPSFPVIYFCCIYPSIILVYPDCSQAF